MSIKSIRMKYRQKGVEFHRDNPMKDDKEAQYQLALLNNIADTLHSVGCHLFRLETVGYDAYKVTFTSEDSWRRGRLENAISALRDMGWDVSDPIRTPGGVDDSYWIKIKYQGEVDRHVPIQDYKG